MSSFQITLLIIAGGYLLVKLLFMFSFYVYSHQVEKKALDKQVKLHDLLTQKREEDRLKYQKAYQQLKNNNRDRI